MTTQKHEPFITAHPAVWAWLKESAPTFDFAASLQSAVLRYGALTPKQLAAAEKCAAKLAAKKVADLPMQNSDLTDVFGLEFDTPVIAAPTPKPTMKTDRLTAAFDAAKAKGLKRPVLRFEQFQASLAPATGRNPGAIYIKANGEYVGKIAANGEFFSRNCEPELRAAIEAAIADPLAAAIAFGRRTGQCSCCGRELTNGESIDRGIGPICADKFGM